VTARSGPPAVALRALGLGDLLTALPALRGLRRHRPGRELLLAAPRWLAPVAALAGAADGVVDTPPLGPVAADRPALAVNLHGRGPESTATLRATGSGELWAFDLPGGEPWERPGRPDGPEEHEVDRWCRLLGAHGVETDPAELDLPRPEGGSPRPGVTIVHPGGAAACRRWPAPRWAAVARALAAGGHDVAVTGGPGEVALAEDVARRAGLPPAAVYAGRTDLLQLCALVAEARVVLAADTGVGHLATAYGTPSVLLFGPVSPDQWGPPADRPQHLALWSGRPGDPGAPTTDPGLATLTPADVLTASDSLPGR